jgi:hypothetical protein
METVSSYLPGFRSGAKQPNFPHMRKEEESNWHSSERSNFEDIMLVVC